MGGTRAKRGSASGRVRQRSAERIEDGIEHAFAVFDDVDVPEAQHAIAMLAEPDVSRCVVVLPFGMLSAIDFDHEVALQADEIDDVGTDGMLAPKAVAAELTPPQEIPEPIFDFGRQLAEMAGARVGHARESAFLE